MDQLKPGVYRNLPGETYYGLPHLSASAIRVCKGSTRKLHYELTKPKEKPTEPMIFGNAFHTYCLEPERFDVDYHTLPQGHKGNTIEGKAELRKCAERGQIPLKYESFKQIANMRSSMVTHTWLMRYFCPMPVNCDIEISFVSEWEGVMVKSRLDTYYPDEGISIDLKTTRDSSPDKWRYEIRDSYLIQAAIYVQQLKEHKLPYKGFYFAAVDKAEPHNTAVYSIEQRDIDAKWEEVRDLLRRYKRDLKEGLPHYNTEPTKFAYSQPEVQL